MEQEMEKQKVNKPYSCRPRAARSVQSLRGSGILPKNDYFIEDGKQKAKPGKGIDLFPYLKASQASTDLASIVARLKAGDESVINVRSDGISGDFVGQPKSVNDVMNLKTKLNKSYEALPVEVKAVFKSEQEFYESCLDGTIKDKLASVKYESLKADVKTEVKPEVKPDEKVK